MGFQDAIISGFRSYATFTGRAPRSGYWYWVLFTMLGGLVTATWDMVLMSGVQVTEPVFHLVTLLPTLAVAARRLHDIDRSGWWQLLWFLPVIGWIILIVWHCKPGTPGANRFG